jgi:hypothetical protein
MYASTDLLDFCSSEYNEINEMREEQYETREQRLQKKRALISRILNPTVESSKSEKGKKKKGKKKADSMLHIAIKPESNLANPDEVIIQREGLLKNIFS